VKKLPRQSKLEAQKQTRNILLRP
jgi:hypothetical protein